MAKRKNTKTSNNIFSKEYTGLYSTILIHNKFEKIKKNDCSYL